LFRVLRPGRVVAIVAAAFSTVGCATISRGTSVDFTVESTPPDAQVVTSNLQACDSTPCTFKMSRKDDFTVTVSKDGYKPSETSIKSGTAADGSVEFVGNALIGGVIGAAIDVNSGAMNDLRPNPLRVVLEPLPPAEAPPTTPADPPATAAPPPPAPEVPVPPPAPTQTTP